MAPFRPVLRTFGSLLALTAAAVAACDSKPFLEPGTGAVRIVISTSGPDPDEDGYYLRLGGAEPFHVTDDEPTVLPHVPSGPQVLRLSDLAPNCVATAGDVKTVPVRPGDTTTVEFPVACTAIRGTVVVVVETKGLDPDPNGYTLHLGPLNSLESQTNDTITFTVLAGSYALTVAGLSSQCTRWDAAPGTLVVTAGETDTVAVAMQCGAGVTPEGARLSLAASQTAFSGTDTVVITATLRNDGTAPITIPFANACEILVFFIKPDGTPLFGPFVCTGDAHDIVIGAGESITREGFLASPVQYGNDTFVPLTPGSYRVFASVFTGAAGSPTRTNSNHVLITYQ